MIELYNEDNKDLMARLPNECIDVICIDPPYLYLKNQKLERPFDEKLFFSECKRLLTKKGFIVMFGRGSSFYRWNTILDNLGFTFKEEIIWNKRRATSPTHKVQRYHETITIFTKGKGTINKVKIPYLEVKEGDVNSIKRDIDRLSTALNNPSDFSDLKFYLENKKIPTKSKQNNTTGVTVGNDSINIMSVAPIYLRSIKEGIGEKTIIDITSEQSRVHPTQKPVRLLERLLALVIPQDKERKDIVVADFFGGSFSTMEAVFNMGMNGIACEIDKEYFEAGKQRIESLQPNLFSSEL